MRDDDKKPSPWDDFKPIGDLRGDHRPPTLWDRVSGSLMTLVLSIAIGLGGACYFVGHLLRGFGHGASDRSFWFALVMILVGGTLWGIGQWFLLTAEERRTRRPPKE